LASDLKRAARIAKLLTNLDEVQRAKLTEVGRSIAACKAEQVEILGMFQTEDKQYGQYVELLSRRIKSLTAKVLSLEAERVRVQAEISKSATLRRAGDGFLREAQEEYDSDAQLRNFAECLEIISAQGPGKTK
jgi:hypothetical protein